MTKYKLSHIVFFIGVVALANASCKKSSLQVGDPNDPTIAGNVNTESGLISLAEGGVYTNGFTNGDGWLGDSYFSLPYGYHELMADNIGADASNNQITTVGYPAYFINDLGVKVPGGSNVSIIRTYNVLGGSGNNPVFFQWQNMYALNAACNEILAIAPTITLSGDAATKLNTIKAWCYWWKGYAYSQVGSIYYSGLVQDDPANKSNAHYLPKDSILARSDYYLNLAATTLSGLTAGGDYNTVMGELIPAASQKGHGGILTPAMWVHNINSLLARNIICNKLAPYVNGNPGATISKSSTGTMATADWNQVVTLCTNGIQQGDYVFSAHSTASNSVFSASGGTVAAMTTGNNVSSTFKISVRYIQCFKAGDKRLTTDFNQRSTYNNPFYGTPYNITDSLQQSTTGVYPIGNAQIGEYEAYIGPSYEENELMLAEANIRLGNIATGLSFVDAVRDYQGAGVTHVSGVVTDLPTAMKELTSESRVSLFGRGVSFYNVRRWGWIYDISAGGGQYGQWLYNANGTYDTNVTVDYNFMDYWDIPADETQLNPPAAGTSPILNPNY
jgi:hypothetical protein